MDQNVWWSTIAMDGWTLRPGARYQQLAAAIRDAAQRRLLVPGQRLPAERVLAALVGTSRGTVVRALDDLVAEGLLERIQGSGTFLRTQHTTAVSPSLPEPAPGRDVVDLSRPGPVGPRELPQYDPYLGPDALASGAHSTEGIPALRNALAHFLSEVLRIPTTAEQVYITSGTGESLALLWEGLALTGRTVLVACPTWPDAVNAVGQRAGRVIPVRTDAFGTDVTAVHRLARRASHPVVLLSATTGPAGITPTHSRRHRLAQAVEHTSAITVEDVSDLVYRQGSDEDGEPLAALSDRVVTVGSLDQMLLSGLGIGWLRLPMNQSASFGVSEHFTAPGVGAQLIAARLLAAADTSWLAQLRTRTSARRHRLIEQLAETIPAWTAGPDGQGPGVWLRLPVPETATFAHTARKFGIAIGVGARYCVDGVHHDHIWLSAGHDEAVLGEAVDSLAAAWHDYTHRVAATV